MNRDGDGQRFMSTVKLGPKGQIVIPKEVREMFGLEPGDSLLLLADAKRGIALQRSSVMTRIADAIFPVTAGRWTGRRRRRISSDLPRPFGTRRRNPHERRGNKRSDQTFWPGSGPVRFGSGGTGGNAVRPAGGQRSWKVHGDQNSHRSVTPPPEVRLGFWAMTWSGSGRR